MGNNRNGANQRIKKMCVSRNIDEISLYARSKLLLETYRDACWGSVDEAEDICERLNFDYSYCSADLNNALICLENFAPEGEKERYTGRINSLFEVKGIIGVIDTAMVKVREFPLMGELYAALLSDCYLNRSMCTENELMENYHMERSTLYRKKKEAIKVFGLAVWGGTIDEFRRLANNGQMTIYDIS